MHSCRLSSKNEVYFHEIQTPGLVDSSRGTSSSSSSMTSWSIQIQLQWKQYAKATLEFSELNTLHTHFLFPKSIRLLFYSPQCVLYYVFFSHSSHFDRPLVLLGVYFTWIIDCRTKTSLLYTWQTSTHTQAARHTKIHYRVGSSDYCRKFGNMIGTTGKLTMVLLHVLRCVACVYV